MDAVQYSKFTGTDQSTDPIDASQTSFLKLENFIANRQLGALFPRGGSRGWAVTGDIWGLAAYARDTSSTKVPISETIIRHRRTAAITAFERLNYSTSAWDNITLGSQTFFDIGNTTAFTQVADLMAICGGRPAQLRADLSTITRLGGPKPTAAPSVAPSSTGLTGTFRWVYTFYDPSTGWESSPSAPTALTTLTNQGALLTGLQTVCARENVTKKRIYRTIETGEDPFLRVTEIDLATTSYLDTLNSNFLGTTAPDFEDHNPPPSLSYLVHAHEDRLWIADGVNLWYSKIYDGAYSNLEYFSPDRLEIFPKRITGLATRPGGGLLVFQPPGFGIFEITGRTESEFKRQIQYPDEGTNFKDSVSSNGTLVAFWSADGPTFINDAGVDRELSFKVRNVVKDALLSEYNGDIFVWTVWNTLTKQFIFSYSVSDTARSDWYDPETGLPVFWIDEVTGQQVTWGVDQDQLGPGGSEWFSDLWFGDLFYFDPWI